MRFFLCILAITFQLSFLHAEEPLFKFSFGSNLGNIPIEINKTSKNIKKSPGININSWILSTSFLSFIGNEENLNFSKGKDFKESMYIKFNFKF